MFVSYWSKGKPADIMFNYEIVGTDPIYGFTRICDSTRAVRVFDGKVCYRWTHSVHPLLLHSRTLLFPLMFQQELTTELARTTTKTTRIPFQQTDRITLNLTGKCFHVALIIQNYESDCPWSSCDEGYALVGQVITTFHCFQFLSTHPRSAKSFCAERFFIPASCHLLLHTTSVLSSLLFSVTRSWITWGHVSAGRSTRNAGRYRFNSANCDCDHYLSCLFLRANCISSRAAI